MYDRPWHALHRSLAAEALQGWIKKPATPIFSVNRSSAMTSWLARALAEAPKMAQHRP